MKVFWTLFFLLLSSVKIVAYAQDSDLVNLIPKCKPAVISIYTYDENNNAIASGTGFFIDSLGTALSCYHVFEGASSAIVKTSDYREFLVNNIISQNKELDILKFSVTKSSSESFQYLKINKSSVKEGESIFVIGNPFGLENSISEGIVSSIRDFTEYGRIIQTTAPISSGSSGSPLLNKKGEVIGIIRFTFSKGQNLNFAINIQESNLLTPVGRLIYPQKDYFEINTFQRANWCDTKEKISEIEHNSILDRSILSEGLNSDIKGKISSASILLFRNVYLNKIKANIEYTFKNNCLTNIRISSSNSFQDEYKSMNSLLEEFILLVNYFFSVNAELKIYFLFENTKSLIEKEVFRKDNISELSKILLESGGYFGFTFDDYDFKSNYLVLIYGKDMQLWTIDIKPL